MRLRNIAADRSGALALQSAGAIPALVACAASPGSAAWRAASALANLAEWQEVVPELIEVGWESPGFLKTERFLKKTEESSRLVFYLKFLI